MQWFEDAVLHMLGVRVNILYTWYVVVTSRRLFATFLVMARNVDVTITTHCALRGFRRFRIIIGQLYDRTSFPSL
jgi:hypothetical protein